MADVSDLRATIIPRSDQLNSEQLLGGPMVITVTDVRAGGGEDQPVSIYYATDPARPYKPCKTCRKVLILAWGPDGRKWIGRSMELYCEPDVKFGGETVGGIRISRLSDIPKEIRVSLTATKGRKALHEIGPLKLSDALAEVLADIAAATGRESLKKARTKAEALKSPADMELAVAAYKKRVEALKEKAASTTPTDRPDTGSHPTDDPAPTGDAQEHPQAGQDRAGEAAAGAPMVSYAQLAARLLRAPDRDAGDLVLDEARALPADQQQELRKIADERWPVER